MSRIGGPITVIIAMFGLAVATLTTNIAANVVAPANGFSNVAPTRISFKAGVLITAVIGILMMPWRLYSDAAAYIFTWLIGYGALLGPVAGIMITDYFLLRRHRLDVEGLYRSASRRTSLDSSAPLAWSRCPPWRKGSMNGPGSWASGSRR
jgi:NCS1 family nucleobase:cation symporter-1